MFDIIYINLTDLLFTRISICPGHARCHVDAGFANIKKLYRRSDCETIGQLEDIVNKSSMANLAVRYLHWSWRDWKQFLDGVFKPLKNIRYIYKLDIVWYRINL